MFRVVAVATSLQCSDSSRPKNGVPRYLASRSTQRQSRGGSSGRPAYFDLLGATGRDFSQRTDSIVRSTAPVAERGCSLPCEPSGLRINPLSAPLTWRTERPSYHQGRSQQPL